MDAFADRHARGDAKRALARWAELSSNAAQAAGPPLLFGLRLWASVCLALYVSFWLELDNAFWAGTSAAIVAQPQLGASLRKGWYRMLGTLVGAIAIVILTACFPQERVAYIAGLALWCAASAAAATLLRNFAAYGAALAGITAAIIAADQLGTTGGPSGDVFMLAITRSTEICIGIVSAGVVFAVTDSGEEGERRLAASFAALGSEIAGRFAATLDFVGENPEKTRQAQRALTKQVIALDPVLEVAIGESTQLRSQSAVLQTAVDGLFAALAGWRGVASHLQRLPEGELREEANAVLRCLPGELRPPHPQTEPMAWGQRPIHLQRLFDAGRRRLEELPSGDPSLRFLADQSGGVLGGLSHALSGIALLVDDPARPPSTRLRLRFHVADGLPALLNGCRAIVAITVVALFWIVTAWPGGALAVTWTAIPIIFFSPRSDQAYGASVSFMAGNTVAAVFAAIVAFGVLPGLMTFPGLTFALALVLVPVGALLVRSGQSPSFVGLTANFVPLLGPANQMVYDTAQFYNMALSILAGNGAAALALRLVPPLSPAFRARRLLALSVRDLRLLATGPIPESPEDWEHRSYARLWALPDETSPTHCSGLLVALSMGTEIIQLRRAAARIGMSPDVDRALRAFASRENTLAAALLGRIEQRLAGVPGSAPEAALAVRARASIVAIVETLTQHASYFDAGVHS